MQGNDGCIKILYFFYLSNKAKERSNQANNLTKYILTAHKNITNSRSQVAYSFITVYLQHDQPAIDPPYAFVLQPVFQHMLVDLAVDDKTASVAHQRNLPSCT